MKSIEDQLNWLKSFDMKNIQDDSNWQKNNEMKKNQDQQNWLKNFDIKRSEEESNWLKNNQMKNIQDYSNWLKKYKYKRLDIRVQKAVKTCKGSKIVEKGSCDTHPELKSVNENESLSGHLLHLKSSCNEASRDIIAKETQTIRMKNEASIKWQKIKVIECQKSVLQNQIATYEKNLQNVKMKKQSVIHILKNYQHILERMRKDSITFQLRRNQLQKQLKEFGNMNEQKQNKIEQYKSLQSLSLVGLKDVKNQHKTQNFNRLNNLTIINNAVNQKKQNLIKKKQRQSQTQIIQEMAAGDLQDAELIRMKKFFKVQHFLKYLLKAKINRLKHFYQPYELAFFKIKSSTNAKDATQMKENFFNFQARFSQKTNWVKKLQQDIQDIEQQNKQLKIKYKELKDTNLAMLQQFDEESAPQDKEQLKNLSKKGVQCQLNMMKIKQWVNLIAKRLKINNNQSLATLFNDICKQLKSNSPKIKINKAQ